MSQEVHVTLQEWRRLDESVPELRGRELEPRDREIAGQLGKRGALEIVEVRQGLRLRARAHVGRVRIGGLVVTIRPKLDTDDLLPLLRYAYGLRDLQLWSSVPLGQGDHLFQDLLAAQLLAEARELLERGLSRRYVASTEELSSPRGRIDLAAMARRGPEMRTTLPCRHHTRSSDHHLNRLLLAGVRLAARVAKDDSLRVSLRRTASQLATEVSPLPLDSAALDQGERQLNRLVAAYRPALALIRLLHDCIDPSLDDRGGTEAPGFLFDMSRFFQVLVGKLLQDHVPDGTVEPEHVLGEVIRYVPGANPLSRGDPKPRPDFMLRIGARRLPLDAKYRDLWAKKLPREMLYQLAVYAVSQPAPCTAAIIYPAKSPLATEAQLEVRMGTGGHARVALRPLHLAGLARLLRDESAPAVAQRIRLVRQLALGSDHDGLLQPLPGAGPGLTIPGG